MRLSNNKETSIIPGLYYFSLVIFLLTIFLYQQLGREVFRKEEHFYYTLLGIFLLQVYIYVCGKYFEFDSEGEIVTIVNKGMILSNFINYRNSHIEIRRDRILGYKYYNFFIYRRLVILAKDSNGKEYQKHLNVSFIKPKKIKLVRTSLQRLVNKNNEAKV